MVRGSVVVLMLAVMVLAAPGQYQNKGDCPGICTQQYDPVCGSDGKTYGNLCELKAEKRCVNPQLTLVSRGECQTQGGDCPDVCITLHDPVCGSDGKTYSNGCFLGIAACRGNPNLYIVSRGPC